MSACLTRSEPVCAVTRHMLTPFYSVFLLDTSCALPALLISLIRLLRLARAEYEKVTAKGKLPKGKLKPESDEDAPDILRIVKDALERKAGEYAGGADPEMSICLCCRTQDGKSTARG